MTQQEKDALMVYLEYQLVALADTMVSYAQPNVKVGTIYKKSLDLLQDIDRTLQTQVDISSAPIQQ